MSGRRLGWLVFVLLSVQAARTQQRTTFLCQGERPCLADSCVQSLLHCDSIGRPYTLRPPAVLDRFDFVEKTLYPVLLNGYWAVADEFGTLLCEPIYDDAPWFYTKKIGGDSIGPKVVYGRERLPGLAIVCKSGKWGVVDLGFNVLIPFKYDSIIGGMCSKIPYFVVCTEEKTLIVNMMDELIFVPKRKETVKREIGLKKNRKRMLAMSKTPNYRAQAERIREVYDSIRRLNLPKVGLDEIYEIINE